MRRLSIAALALGLLATAGTARAQSGEAAMAEQLFRDAKQLQGQKRFAEACPKYAESVRLAPTLGAQLNLARCYEEWGHTASAWGEYVEVARKGSGVDPERAQLARERAANLEKSLSRVTFRAVPANPKLTLTLDGKAFASSLLGSAVPIDPGPHSIIASAPDMKPSTQSITIAPGPSATTVEIKLEPAAAAARSTDSTPAVVTEPPPAAPSSDARRPIGWTVLSVGAAGLVVGGVFGALALGKKSDFEACQTSGACRDDELAAARDAHDTARTDALVSTIGFGAGLVGVAVGTYLLLTARPNASSARLAPRFDPRGPGALLTTTF